MPEGVVANMITVERVKAAYEKAGIRPIRNHFVMINNAGEKCGCGLTAILVGEGIISFEDWLEGNYGTTLPSEFIARQLDLTEDQVRGFMDGFDGSLCLYDSRREYYEIGKACRKELIGE
jgi:hypothetical protein